MSKESCNAPKSFPGVLLISPISPLGTCAACCSDLIAVPLHLSLLNAILLDLVLESSLLRPFWILILSSNIFSLLSDDVFDVQQRVTILGACLCQILCFAHCFILPSPTLLSTCCHHFIILFLYLFILFINLHQVLVTAHGIFSCGMWNLVPWRGIKSRPLHWECRLLATGRPGSPYPRFISEAHCDSERLSHLSKDMQPVCRRVRI